MTQGSPHTSGKSLDQIEAEAGAWIARRDEGDWSAAAQEEFDSWLALSPAHMVAFLRFDDVWRRANRLQALGRPAKAGAFALSWRPKRRFFLTAAAGVLVAVLVGISLLLNSSPEEATYSTAVGERKLLKLADGSEIDLNTNTVLRLSHTTNSQVAKLDKGEAFFRIHHDPNRTFVVMAGGRRVVDIGTKFAIRAEPNHLEVTLVEGKARLDAPDGSLPNSILLTPGDHLTIANNVVTTTKQSPRKLSEELGWRRGMLIFDHARLADVVAELNRYGGRKLVVADRDTARIPVSASFPTNGADSFLELAKAMLGVTIQQRDNETVITRGASKAHTDMTNAN